MIIDMKILKYKECEVIMKRNFNEDIDEKITQFFMDETENISISQNSFYKIKSGILR